MRRLYGKGAIAIAHGKTTYRPVGGVLTVPDALVDRARALGFSLHAPDPVDETPLDAPVTVHATLPAGHPAAGTVAAVAARDRKAADEAEQGRAKARR